MQVTLTVILIAFILVAVPFMICVTNKHWFVKIKPGDVLLSRHLTEDPFEDYEWKYMTVIEVKTNYRGRQYFRAYMSNKFGRRSPDNVSDDISRLFDPEFYKIVNSNMNIEK